MKKAVKAAKGTAQVVWLGLATLVGVALLIKMGPMLIGERDAPETAVAAESDPMEFGETVPVVDQGSWMVSEERDPMDDSREVTAILQSHDADDVALVAGCTDNRTSVMVYWDDYLGSSRAIPVTHRFPPAPAQRSNWFGNSNTTFKMNAIPMLREAVSNPELIVRVTPYSGGPVTATFNLTGAREAIGKVANACGWEL